MQRVIALIAAGMTGGTAPFRHGRLEIGFCPWAPGGLLPLLDGGVIAFIDWLPVGNEVCRELRRDPATAGAQIAVVLGGVAHGAGDVAMAAGADICVPGPLTRTAALDLILSRLPQLDAQPAPPPALWGDLVVDRTRACWCGRPVPLLPNDRRLLHYLAQYPGRVLTRAQIVGALGKEHDAIDPRTVDVWIGRLRRALARAGAALPIRTVRGLGYVLDRP